MSNKYRNNEPQDNDILDFTAIDKSDIDQKIAAKFFMAYFNSSPIGIYIIQNGRFKFANVQFQKLTGYSLEELQGITNPIKLIHPKDRNSVRENASQMLSGENSIPYQYRYIKKDGNFGWAKETVVSIQISKNSFILGSFININNQKDAEKEASDNQEYYQILFEHHRDAVLVFTPEGSCVKVNPAACQLLGYEPEELIRMSIFDLMPFGKAENTLFDKLLLQGNVFGEIKLITKDGSSIVAEINATELPDGNYLGTVRDVTERKRMAGEMARLERLNLIGEMAAGIGHEIRNPMTSVRGFLQMLTNKGDCSNYLKYFNIMIDELDRANNIITEFLSLAKNKPIELKVQSINDVVKALEPLIAVDSINCKMYYEIDLGDIGNIVLDEKQIRQLILNLVRNGLEAMEPGGTITIKTFIDGGEVVLMVKDNGCGINPQVLGKIGDPFVTTKENGTGLGLAVCYGVASRHSAKIEMETGPSGTTFFVRFRADV